MSQKPIKVTDDMAAQAVRIILNLASKDGNAIYVAPEPTKEIFALAKQIREANAA